MHAVLVEAVPAAALRVLSVAFEIGLPRAFVHDVVFAGHVVDRHACAADNCSALSNCAGLERWVMSPVWSINAGFCGSALTWSMASLSVSMACGLAGLSKPTWLSEICRNVKPAAAASAAASAPSRSPSDFGTPALTRPEHTGTRPNHAFERVPPADAVVVMIVMCHSFSLSKSPEFGASERETLWTGRFIPVAKSDKLQATGLRLTGSAQHAGATGNVKLTFQPRHPIQPINHAQAYFAA